MKTTANFLLNKPELTDSVGVTIPALSANCDIIDAQMHKLAVVPYCFIYSNNNVAIANSAYTLIPVNTTAKDTDNMHTAGATRLVCKTAGIYLITGCITFAASPNGVRSTLIRVNGGLRGENDSPAMSDYTSMNSVTTITSLAVNDYIELWAWQNNGTAIAGLMSGSGISLQAIKIG